MIRADRPLVFRPGFTSSGADIRLKNIRYAPLAGSPSTGAGQRKTGLDVKKSRKLATRPASSPKRRNVASGRVGEIRHIFNGEHLTGFEDLSPSGEQWTVANGFLEGQGAAPDWRR